MEGVKETLISKLWYCMGILTRHLEVITPSAEFWNRWIRLLCY